MATQIGELIIGMAADVARLRKDMGDAKSTVGAAMRDIRQAADTAKTALGAIGATLSVSALAMLTKSAIDFADGVNDMSQRIGVSVRSLAGWQLAAEQSGTTTEALAKGIKGLSDGRGDVLLGNYNLLARRLDIV